MDGDSESEAAASLRRRALASMPGTFLRVEEFAAACDTVEAELRLLVLEGELVEVWSGLYYRGVSTRFGMTRPPLLDTAVAVAGLGSGPSGVAAAHMLGLTTQVPGIADIALPGRVPAHMFGVRFHQRPYGRRERRLSAIEVAVVEILRDPGSMEVSRTEAFGRLTRLVQDAVVRGDVLAATLTDERDLGALDSWRELIAWPS